MFERSYYVLKTPSMPRMRTWKLQEKSGSVFQYPSMLEL